MFKLKDDELLDVKVDINTNVSAWVSAPIWDNASVDFEGHMRTELILSFSSGRVILPIEDLVVYNDEETNSTMSLAPIFKLLLDLERQGKLEHMTSEEISKEIKNIVDFELSV